MTDHVLPDHDVTGLRAPRGKRLSQVFEHARCATDVDDTASENTEEMPVATCLGRLKMQVCFHFGK